MNAMIIYICNFLIDNTFVIDSTFIHYYKLRFCNSKYIKLLFVICLIENFTILFFVILYYFFYFILYVKIMFAYNKFYQIYDNS